MRVVAVILGLLGARPHERQPDGSAGLRIERMEFQPFCFGACASRSVIAAFCWSGAPSRN